MLQDLHSHTYYSFCGKDKPELLLDAAVEGGLKMFGINDHNYGIGYQRIDFFNSSAADFSTDYARTLSRYFDHLSLLKEKYADRIILKRGIEINTIAGTRYALPDDADISYYDYCLVENLDLPEEQTVTHNDIFSFAKRCGCPTGIAHTDMFALIERLHKDPYEYFFRMAQENIFWEMNVSYDSIHGYRVHPYMTQFFENKAQQDIVRRSGVRLSVGFDGHRIEDYLPERVKDYCRQVEDMGIRMMFEE